MYQYNISKQMSSHLFLIFFYLLQEQLVKLNSGKVIQQNFNIGICFKINYLLHLIIPQQSRVVCAGVSFRHADIFAIARLFTHRFKLTSFTKLIRTIIMCSPQLKHRNKGAELEILMFENCHQPSPLHSSRYKLLHTLTSNCV